MTGTARALANTVARPFPIPIPIPTNSYYYDDESRSHTENGMTAAGFYLNCMVQLPGKQEEKSWTLNFKP